MGSLRDKVVFITGGNSGIGLATALAFAREGCKVALLARRVSRNEEARREIEQEGVRCLTFTGDVSKEADLASALGQTVKELGGLHFAFNNAGIEQLPTPLVEQSEEDYQRVLDVNVKGVWLAMKHEAPLIQSSGGGCIINTSSVAGLVGMARVSLYVAAKHAVIGLTRAVALEYAQSGVRINAICPAAVRTQMYERFTGRNPEVEKGLEAMHPMGRAGTPEEVASGVLYLCRDATWTTGQALTMDGGFTCQ